MRIILKESDHKRTVFRGAHNIIIQTVFRAKINLHPTLLYLFTRVTVARLPDMH